MIGERRRCPGCSQLIEINGPQQANEDVYPLRSQEDDTKVEALIAQFDVAAAKAKAAEQSLATLKVAKRVEEALSYPTFTDTHGKQVYACLNNRLVAFLRRFRRLLLLLLIVSSIVLVVLFCEVGNKRSSLSPSEYGPIVFCIWVMCLVIFILSFLSYDPPPTLDLRTPEEIRRDKTMAIAGFLAVDAQRRGDTVEYGNQMQIMQNLKQLDELRRIREKLEDS